MYTYSVSDNVLVYRMEVHKQYVNGAKLSWRKKMTSLSYGIVDLKLLLLFHTIKTVQKLTIVCPVYACMYACTYILTHKWKRFVHVT